MGISPDVTRNSPYFLFPLHSICCRILISAETHEIGCEPYEAIEQEQFYINDTDNLKKKSFIHEIFMNVIESLYFRINIYNFLLFHIFGSCLLTKVFDCCLKLSIDYRYHKHKQLNFHNFRFLL